MKRWFLKLSSKNKLLFSLPLLLLIVALFIFWPHISYADSLSNAVTKVVGWIVYGLVWVLGKILIVLINLVIWVAQYNDFIQAPAVTNGWLIVRDVCNMFFVLILLVIAFATTVNMESYAMKRLLPKFIIAAVLINFSKLICGVIIDFAQVIMLTFVNGFRDIGGGNLADMLGITKLLSISQDACGKDIDSWAIMGSFILALIYVIIATVVIAVILMVLVMRMVMIWVYVVLSPMAWLLSVLPATQTYSSQWWKQFSESVASGPILAFFIWLSFASVTMGSSGQSILKVAAPSASEEEKDYIKSINDTGDPCVGASEAGSTDSMLKFVISIGLLIGGLIVTKQAGGAIGSIAGSGLSKIQRAAKGTAKFAAKATGKAALTAGKFTGRNLVGGAGFIAKKAGAKISEKSGGRFGTGLQKAGQFATDARADWKETVDDKKAAKKQKRLEKFGLKAKSMQSLDEFRKDSRIGKIVSSAASGSVGDLFKIKPGEKVNYMGDKMKKMSFGYQRWRNKSNAAEDVENTKRLVEEKEGKLSASYKDGAKKTDFLNKEETKETDAINKEWQQARANKQPADVARIDQIYQDRLANVADHYNRDRKFVSDKYEKETTPEQRKSDQENGLALASAQAYHEKAKKFNEDTQATNNYKNKKADLKKEGNVYKDALDELKKEKEEAIKEAKSKFGGSSFAMQGEMDRINSKYTPLENEIHEKHKDRVKNINDKYVTESTMPLGGVATLMHKTGDKMSNYDPTRLTGKALEKGAADIKAADDIAKALKSSLLKEFESIDFSKATGISSQHERVYKQLANKSQGSLDSLKGLIDQLKTIQANGALTKNSREANVINSLKKGLAHYLKKNPGDSGSFKDVVDELNKIDARHDKGWKKVSDFTPKD